MAPRSKGRLPAELVEMVTKQLQGTQASNEIRRRWMARNEPSAKLARQQERLRRWLVFLLVLVTVFSVIAVVGAVGMAEGGEINAVLLPGLLAVGSGALAVQSGTKLRRVRRELDAAPPSLQGLAMASRERLPPAGSSAREPMQRLREYEMSFSDLLKQMWGTDGVGPVPQHAVRDAVGTADTAAAAVRRLGEQLRAMEGARNAAPRGERDELAEVVRGLRQRMDDGVAGYGKLVAAAGRAVAASTPATDHEAALTDATDQLAGIAMALQELSERDKLDGS